MALVTARRAGTSIRVRGVSASTNRATGLPRRVVQTVSPAAARSTNSLKRVLAFAIVMVSTLGS